MKQTERALKFRNGIARYLAELRQLVGRDVAKEELLSVDETETIRARASEVEYSPAWRTQMEFSAKAGNRFRRFIRELHELNPSYVYVWMPLSNVCGVLPPVAISDINFDFDFALNPEGVLVVLTTDFSDKMVLDFSDADGGGKVLEVEVAGQNWGAARL